MGGMVTPGAFNRLRRHAVRVKQSTINQGGVMGLGTKMSSCHHPDDYCSLAPAPCFIQRFNLLTPQRFLKIHLRARCHTSYAFMVMLNFPETSQVLL